MRLQLETETSRLLFILLLTDLVFLFLHVLGKTNILTSAMFELETNGGYAEIFQYIKEFWIAGLLTVLFAARRKGCYLAWTCLFAYLLADDSLQIHERVGEYLTQALALEPAFNLRAVDLGELLVIASAGGLLFLAIGSTYFSGDKEVRRFTNRLFVLILLFAGCGVLFDMTAFMITWGHPLWDFMQNGGELVIMSLMLWYVFAQRPGPGESPAAQHPDQHTTQPP